MPQVPFIRHDPAGCLRIGPLPLFNLRRTLECGQCFRWESIPPPPAYPDISWWVGTAGKNHVIVGSDHEDLLFAGTTEEVLRDYWMQYFDLDTDHTPLLLQLSDSDPVMSTAIAQGPGLRLLRQEPWETLASFLMSQNNGIPRIRQIIANLCQCFGASRQDEVSELFPHVCRMPDFPTAHTLALLDLDNMSACKAGYRSRYLLDAARAVVAGDVDLCCLSHLSLAEARTKLCELNGVGDKVADCTLLFSGLHREAFPIDRWVLRIMEAWYPGSGKSKESLQEFAANKWGALAGLAQEYLFDYARQTWSDHSLKQ